MLNKKQCLKKTITPNKQNSSISCFPTIEMKKYTKVSSNGSITKSCNVIENIYDLGGSNMEIRSGKYAIRFENGGIQVLKMAHCYTTTNVPCMLL